MKKLIFSLVLLFFSSSLYATSLHGINYDPAHSDLYAKGFATGNINVMRNSIDNDLLQIKGKLGINTIKTFYSVFSPQNGKGFIDIVPEAKKFNLKVMLGVFEFVPGTGCNDEKTCEKWTKMQVQHAIEEANVYPNTVIGIAVGNEDAGNPVVEKRIVADAKTIQSHLKHKLKLGIGTAQTLDETKYLIQHYQKNNPNDLLNNINFLGVNIYPFWGNMDWNDQTKQWFFNTFHQLSQSLSSENNKVKLIETEEGWPSEGASNASLTDQQAYFQWWKSRERTDDFISFYFATFDKLTSNMGLADSYFGVFNFSGDDKDSPINGITIYLSNLLKDAAIVNACDFSGGQPICWPLNGLASASEVNLFTRDMPFKVDKRIPDYLLITLDKSPYPAACIIPKSALINGNVIDITWSKDGKGDENCGISVYNKK